MFDHAVPATRRSLAAAKLSNRVRQKITENIEHFGFVLPKLTVIQLIIV